MSSAELVALVLVLAIAAYACGGGADFGAGFWDLIAGNQDRGARPPRPSPTTRWRQCHATGKCSW